MLDQKEVTIKLGGEPKQFVIQQFPTTRGLQVMTYLTKIIAGMADGIGDAPEGDLGSTPLNIGGIIGGLIKRMDVTETPNFIRRVITESVIKPQIDEKTFDSMFSGEYDAMLELVEKIVEHNNFSEALKKRLAVIISSFLSDTVQNQAKSTPSS